MNDRPSNLHYKYIINEDNIKYWWDSTYKWMLYDDDVRKYINQNTIFYSTLFPDDDIKLSISGVFNEDYELDNCRIQCKNKHKLTPLHLKLIKKLMRSEEYPSSFIRHVVSSITSLDK